MLDYIFYDGLHGELFSGATGTRFRPVTQSEIDDRNNPENLKSEYEWLWKEAVQAGNTQDGLDDYIESMIRDMELNGNGEFFIAHDTSYLNKIPEGFMEKHFPDAVTFECIGGGRCFDKSLSEDDFKILLEPKLLKEIKKAEAQS